MRVLWMILVALWPLAAFGQSAQVDPADLTLELIVEDQPAAPHVGEMVMITIRGTYRRHITRETLVQPALEGFNWSQLGTDTWRDERIDGRLVKVMERQMALYPTRPGLLVVEPFRHSLTLTDAGDDWFEHEIASAPLEIEVAPIPKEAQDDWWFPVRRLEISDEWSNAPDRLQPGEGVLRIVRIEALGATPEMIPPMPEMTSPSAMIFAHPEKRLVELTPQGPVTYAFWRWTVRPSNETSTILEPIVVDYFDTTTRRVAKAHITPQRVAYLEGNRATVTLVEQSAARLPGWPEALVGAFVLLAGVVLHLRQRQFVSWQTLARARPFDPLRRRVRQAARVGDAAALRRAMQGLLRRRDVPLARAVMARLDPHLFGSETSPPDLRALAREFESSWSRDSGGA